ncbi:hypothetical protein BH20ACI2_BH20ACI2_05410 [soil metagenome]
MPLGTVAEVLSHGGYLPQLVELSNKKKTIFSRRNGMAFSLIWCLFFLFIMTPLWGIMNVDKIAGVSAIIGIFGGLIWLLTSLIFLKKDSPNFMGQQSFMPPAQRPDLHGQQGYTALPPQQSIPASAYGVPQAGSWRDTNDLQPTSVTESTTKLLEKDES